MVSLTKIYTRGGDKGQTSLGDGKRVGKHDARVEAFGTVDETNAVIGLARLNSRDAPEIDAMLSRIQNDLFDLGADLCVPGEAGDRLRLTETPVRRLDAEAAAMNAALPKLTSFILPGGTPAAAHAHVARTAARHAERTIVALAAEATVNPLIMRYLNRLSDHLFILARVLNDHGKADVLWQPGANR